MRGAKTLAIAALAVGALAFLATPSTAQAGWGVSVGIGGGFGFVGGHYARPHYYVAPTYYYAAPTYYYAAPTYYYAPVPVAYYPRTTFVYVGGGRHYRHHR